MTLGNPHHFVIFRALPSTTRPIRSEESLQKLANNVILSEAEGFLKQWKISRRHIKRYFTALCSVQYDKPANNVILSEVEGSLKQRKISRKHIMRYFTALCSVQYDNSANNVILSEAEGSLK